MLDYNKILQAIVSLNAVNVMQDGTLRVAFPMRQPPYNMRTQSLPLGHSARAVWPVHTKAAFVVNVAVIPVASIPQEMGALKCTV